MKLSYLYLTLCQLLSASGRGGELDVDLDGLDLGSFEGSFSDDPSDGCNAAKRSSAVGDTDPGKGAKIAMAKTLSGQEKYIQVILSPIAVPSYLL